MDPERRKAEEWSDDPEEEAPAGRRSIPGSVSWVPASAGLRLAEHVVLSLVGLQSGSSVIQ